MMKRTLFLAIICLSIFTAANAQYNMPSVDRSPMDMCYCPDNYPNLKIQGKETEPPVARVIYSRPKRDGRTVFGGAGLVPYGQVWRLGANEATEIQFYKPVMLGGKKVAAGRYTLYALVNEKSWTFILNKDTDTWGAFIYDESKDIARVTVPVEENKDTVESLTMVFAKADSSTTNLVVAWENLKVTLPINF
jgi:hypothetical protein